jgi:hypothetical protein
MVFAGIIRRAKMTQSRPFAISIIVLLIVFSIATPAYALPQTTADCLILSKPLITGPADGAVLFRNPNTGELNEKFTWSSITGVQLYYYQIFSSPSGMEVTTGNASTNEATLQLETGIYTWHVAGLDQTPGCTLVGEWSDTRSFQVKDNDVVPPVNFQATDGTYPDRVVLTWDLDLQGGSYQPNWFSVYRKPVVSDGIEEIGHHLGPDMRTFTDLNPLTNEIYSYWIVAGNDLYGEQSSQWDGGNASKCIPVGTPVQKEPANGVTVFLDPDAGMMDYYSWSRPAGVYYYQVQTVDASNGALLFGQTAEGESSNIPLSNPGTYRWRVRALSPVQNCAAGPWTGYWTFTVDRIYAYPVINFHAGDGIFSDRVWLTWDVDDSRGAGFVDPDWFTIYRADSPTGQKTKIARIDFGQMQRYEDKSIQPGKKYTYWVLAEDFIQYPNWSEPDEGWARADVVQGSTVYIPFVRR